MLATDIDPRFIPPSQLSQLKVARHDVTTDEIPAARYDLIYTRLVLSHLPKRHDVLARLLEALHPGGWLVIEDFCHAFERGSEAFGRDEARYKKVHAALGDFVSRFNADESHYAASLPQLLVSVGLADVGGEARVVFARGGSAAARVIEAGLRQVGDQMIAAGLIDRPALDEAIAYVNNPAAVVPLPTLVSAWGRRG